MQQNNQGMLQLHFMFAISAPIITVFRHGQRYPRKPNYLITSDSYVFIEADGRDCEIYFSTDGSPPNFSDRCCKEVERTFKYRSPFQLHPGKRTIMAIAFNRSLMRQSLTAVQQFDVIDHHDYGYRDSDDDIDKFGARQYSRGALDWESDDDSITTDVSNARYGIMSCRDWQDMLHFRKLPIREAWQAPLTQDKQYPELAMDDVYDSADRLGAMDIKDWISYHRPHHCVNCHAADISPRRCLAYSSANRRKELYRSCLGIHRGLCCANLHEHCYLGKTHCPKTYATDRDEAAGCSNCRCQDNFGKVEHHQPTVEQVNVEQQASSQKKDGKKMKQSSSSSDSSRHSSRSSSKSSKTSRSSSSSSSSRSSSSRSSSHSSDSSSNKDRKEKKKKKKSTDSKNKEKETVEKTLGKIKKNKHDKSKEGRKNKSKDMNSEDDDKRKKKKLKKEKKSEKDDEKETDSKEKDGKSEKRDKKTKKKKKDAKHKQTEGEERKTEAQNGDAINEMDKEQEMEEERSNKNTQEEKASVDESKNLMSNRMKTTK